MSDTVTINGREFRVGAWYRGKRGDRRRKFLGVRDQKDFHGDWYVEVLWQCTQRSRNGCDQADWSRWAGEEVQP